MKTTWRHFNKDGDYTYDWYLYVGGKCTDNLVSANGEIYYAYINDKKVNMMFDSLREAKEYILEKLRLN